jgi:hypothetical protein
LVRDMAAACVPIEAFLTNDKVKSDAPMAGCCCCMDLRGGVLVSDQQTATVT